MSADRPQQPEQPVEDVEALLALDALEADEQADAELRYGTFEPALALHADALADLVAADPPAELRPEVLRGALARRPGGHPVGRPEPASPIEAFRRTRDDLHALLDELDPAEWARPAHPQHGAVRDVVAHLAGVEELVLAWVGARPPIDPSATADHIAATRGAVDALADEPVASVTARWYTLATESADACAAAPPDQPIVAHDLPTDVDGLLLLRTFELWAHMHDICAATGRARPTLDAPRLAVMSERLAAALPFALALRAGSVPGRTANLVLTGEAGGVYLVPLLAGEEPGEPDTTIVVDVVDLCAVAAQRRDLDELEVVIEGDEALGRQVLASADAFARD